jgi:hypothetical protein
MAVKFKYAKKLWDIIVEKYGIVIPVENKSEMFSKVIEKFGALLGDKKLAESQISQASFLDRFYDRVIDGEDPDLGDKVKGALARIAGFENWNDFITKHFSNEHGKESMSLTSYELPEQIEKLFMATGMTHAYPARTAALPDIKADIALAEESICMYARVFISELVKDPEFAQMIGKIADRGSNTDTPLTVRHSSTDPRDIDLAEKLYKIEDPKVERWKTITEYCNHIKWGHAAFADRHADLTKYLAQRGKKDPDQRRKVQFEDGYIENSLLPYSLVVIDERIVYVSIYSLSSNKYGTFAPTMRLVVEPNDEISWAERFLEEANKIHNQYTTQLKTFELI